MAQTEENNAPVKLGLIGAGLAFKRLHLPALTALKGHFRITAVCDIAPETLSESIRLSADLNKAHFGEESEIRAYSSYRELLQDNEVEAALISLPIHLNAEVMQDAALAGKHLICEKPLAANLAQGRKLAPILESLAATKGLAIEIAENYHYRPELAIAHRWAFEEKLLGEVALITAQNFVRMDTSQGYAATAWRIDNQYRGGILMDGGIHYIAMLRRLAGEVEQVHAFARHMHKTATSSPDTISINLRFRNGTLGNMIYTGASPNLLPPRDQPDCIIYGTHGQIQLSKKNDARLLLQTFDGGGFKEAQYWAAETSSYYEEFLNFYEAIRFGKRVLASPTECLRDLELMCAALDSAEERAVKLL